MNKNLKEKLKIAILRPGGNDTALVFGMPKKSLKKQINDQIMFNYPNVEQVGFYQADLKKKKAKLEMAGGEFCGNATRALAYLLLNGKKDNLKIKVSGSKKILKAGVNSKSTAFAQMPILKSFSSVQKIEDKIWQVELDGITHLIKLVERQLSIQDAKNEAKILLTQYNLLQTRQASGVMFLNQTERGLFIQPVVWVRDIETFFYETACASGTTAVGLYLSLLTPELNTFISVVQPSSEIITVNVEKSKSQFKEALIDGPISVLEDKLNVS